MGIISNLFSSPQAPTPVNPQQMISAQSAASEEAARLQARLNRPQTYTPFGSVTYEEQPGDTWKATQTLSPSMQNLFDVQLQTGQGVGEAALGKVGQLPTDPFSLEGVQGFRGGIDYGGLSDIPGAGDFDAARIEAEEGSFGRVWDRLGTQFGEEETALETTLANKGITMGTDMYKKAFDRFSERKNDARTAAAYDSIAAGRQAFNNLFANALTSRQQGISERGMDVDMANRARAQEIADMQMLRAQPMNELAALLQGAPAVSTPQPIPTSGVGVSPPDVGGAYALAGQQAQQQYATQAGQQSAGLGALANLGSAYLMG